MESKSAERKGTASDGQPASSSSKDIWLLLSSMDPVKPAAAETPGDLTSAPPSNDERDTFTLVVGSKSAGKTSFCSAYIHRSDDKGAGEEPKPTTGLEYMYARQSGAVAHIWELASLRCVPEMMRVPLAPERILQAAVVVVIDLSTPGDVLPHLIKWLTTIHKIVGDVLRVKEKNPVDKASVDRLRKQAMERYDKNHEDTEDLEPIASPVLILGNKFDLFAKEDTALRKPLLQAMRFFAHLFGATLLLTTTKEKPSIAQMRSIFKAYVFGTTSNLKMAKKDVESASKPLYVPAGSDSFADIGLPEGLRKDDVFSGVNDIDTKAKLWKKCIGKVFPASGTVADTWDDGEDNQATTSTEFPEPSIDRARQRKADELQRYRQERQKLEKASKTPVRA